jgi:hypothetical protein
MCSEPHEIPIFVLGWNRPAKTFILSCFPVADVLCFTKEKGGTITLPNPKAAMNVSFFLCFAKQFSGKFSNIFLLR